MVKRTFRRAAIAAFSMLLAVSTVIPAAVMPAYATEGGELFVPLETVAEGTADGDVQTVSEVETEKGTLISELEENQGLSAQAETGQVETTIPMQTQPQATQVTQPTATAPEGESEVQRSRWDIGSGYSRTKTFTVNVRDDVTRIEIFYTKSASIPEVSIISAAGYAYSTKMDTVTDTTSFITRSGFTVNGYDDISYMVMYIKNPSDPGAWNMTVTIDAQCSEAFIMTARVPENWEDLQTDYKTSPTGVIAWAIDGEVSKYKASDITEITKKDENIPAAMHPVEEKEPEAPDYTVVIILVAILLVVMIASLVAYLIYRSQNKEKLDRQDKVKRANERVKARKQKENDHLETILREFDEDYTDDDDDISSYMSISDKEEEVQTQWVQNVAPAQEYPPVRNNMSPQGTNAAPMQNVQGTGTYQGISEQYPRLQQGSQSVYPGYPEATSINVGTQSPYPETPGAYPGTQSYNQMLGTPVQQNAPMQNMTQNAVQQSGYPSGQPGNAFVQIPVQQPGTPSGYRSSLFQPQQPPQPSWLPAQKKTGEEEKVPSWAADKNAVQGNQDSGNGIAATGSGNAGNTGRFF